MTFHLASTRLRPLETQGPDKMEVQKGTAELAHTKYLEHSSGILFHESYIYCFSLNFWLQIPDVYTHLVYLYFMDMHGYARDVSTKLMGFRTFITGTVTEFKAKMS
jgi:hypothetical protein